MAIEERRERKLAVILHADVVGSAALVQRDETLAHNRITRAFSQLGQTIRSYGGKVQEVRGDALVADFPRASDAVSAALSFQQLNTANNGQLTDSIAPAVRIGISLGEVVIADDTVTGPGVVLAQRVEQLAEPGGVCATAAIYEAAPGRLPFDYLDLGLQAAKGFDEPVHVYAVALKSDAPLPSPDLAMPTKTPGKRSDARRTVGAIAVLLLVGGALAIWWLLPWSNDIKAARADRMALELPDRPSIAVVPFENLGGDEAKAQLVDGLTGTLISALAANPRLFVITKGSTSRYKDKDVEPRVVAEEQGVRYVLAGKIQWSGNQMRLTAQLIDAIDGAYVWGERYDRPVADVFKVQDDLVKNILAAVEGELVWAHGPGIWAGMTDNLDAYLHYLNGQKALFRFTQDSNAVAREHAKKAIEIDPAFASGWNLLGWTYYHEGRRGWGETSREEAWSAAKAHALKAIELAPRYGSPRGMLASIAADQKLFDEALSICAEAVKIAPNEAILLANCSSVHDKAGKHRDAVELIGKALRLSPYPPSWFVRVKGRSHFFIGDYATTIESLTNNAQWNLEAKKMAEAILAAAYQASGRIDEAAASVARLLAIDPRITAQRVTETFPSRYEATSRERLVEALIAAGIPTGAPQGLNWSRNRDAMARPDIETVPRLPGSRFLNDRGNATLGPSRN